MAIDDSDFADFISLSRLNRNIVVVVENDRKSPGAGINATKTRLADELGKEPGCSLVWITEGKEIENYLDAAFLCETFKSVVSDFAQFPKRGKKNKPLFRTCLNMKKVTECLRRPPIKK